MSGGWTPTLGAVPGRDGTTSFRAWVPLPRDLRLHLDRGGAIETVAMTRTGDGYWTARATAPPGTRYGYLLDGRGPFPDPASRAQPGGVHALSEVVAPAFAWSDAGWTPPPFRDLVIYECHVGTFTPGGTFDAAIERLPYLAGLGVNAVEVMPVAAFPGRWNWGYDGVCLFAPSERYGGPDGMRRFVDAAHAHGLAVILDVVYNHFGPDGNYTGLFAPYLDESAATPWGAAIAFARPEVRAFYRENLLHWVHEYHVDGFRFDATHTIVDPSPVHVLAELADAAARHPRDGHRAYLVAETHENDVRYVRPTAEGGFGFDAVWADDFHHATRAFLARDRDGYFASFDGSLAEIAAAATRGFVFEGQVERATGRPRGTPARDVPWSSFVFCLQNHDQVGNRAFGERLTTIASHAEMRAATMLLLLLPQVPLLFQGQEHFAASPFQFFTDHEPGLGRLVTEGRRREFASFRAFADAGLRDAIPDPQSEATYRRSQLRPDEATAGIGLLALNYHRALLALRRGDPVLAAYRASRLPIVSAVTGATLVLRFEAAAGMRILATNFGPATTIELPGLASATVLLHSDQPRFGGAGDDITLNVTATGTAITLPPRTAVFVAAR